MMTPRTTLGTTVAVFAVFMVTAVTTAPRGQTPPPSAGVAPQSQTPAPSGRGGDPTAALWSEHCGGCHGEDSAGGRAPSLFDPAWLKATTDEHMVTTIRNGIDGTDMEPFGQVLSADQIWSLVNYIRMQTGNLRPRPEFVANPGGVVLKTDKQTVRVEVVATGLEVPYGLVFLPDGRLLVTERPGRLRVIANGRLSEPVKGMPAVHAVQDGGMLDVDIHPQYAQNGWVYIAYSEVQPGYTPPAVAPAPPTPGRGRGPRPPSMTVIARGRINANNEWVDHQFVYRMDPSLYVTDTSHYGIRFLFDPDGHLLFSLGDRGSIDQAQRLSSPLGKIHRVTDVGQPVADNPFFGRSDALPTIWSYGHRNPQGLAWHPLTGALWESEHGPNSADEINVIRKGHNYGWGVATKASQPGMVPSAPGMDDPVIYYVPSMATSGIAFYTGDRYPGWKNTSLFVGGLVGQRLERLELDGDTVVAQEIIFNQFGRVRDIVQGPDGYFYIALQSQTAVPGIPLGAVTPGQIIRLIPEP